MFQIGKTAPWVTIPARTACGTMLYLALAPLTVRFYKMPCTTASVLIMSRCDIENRSIWILIYHFNDGPFWAQSSIVNPLSVVTSPSSMMNVIAPV